MQPRRSRRGVSGRYLDRHGAGRAGGVALPARHPDPAGRARPPGAARRPRTGLRRAAARRRRRRPTSAASTRTWSPTSTASSNEIERGQRVVQPRLRHRFQVDRHGLARSTHRLIGRGRGRSASSFENNGSPLQQVLGAVYAAERLGAGRRATPIAGVLHKAMRWSGPIGPALIAYLAGSRGARASSLLGLRRPGGVGARRARLPARAPSVRSSGRSWPASAPASWRSTPTTAATRSPASKAIGDLGRGPPHPAPGLSGVS